MKDVFHTKNGGKMLRKISCKHNDIEFIRNIYGDEINQLSGKNTVRSIWRCKNCGRIIYKGKPYMENDGLKIGWR